MKKILKLSGICLTVLSIVFLIVKAYKLGLDVRNLSIGSSTVIFAVIAVLINQLTVLMLSGCYRRTVTLCSSSAIDKKEADRIYCRSNIGKYLPGNVFQYVERNLFLSGHGISQSDAASCSAFEILELLVMGVILSLSFNGTKIFGILRQNMQTEMIIVILVLIVCVFAVVLFLLLRSPKFRSSFTFVKRDGFAKSLLINLPVYCAVLILMGLSFALIMCSFDEFDISVKAILAVTGAFIFSWLAGFVIIGAPGGLGIREAVLASVLTGSLRIETIVTAVVLGRLISVFADIMIWGTTELVYKKGRVKK